MVHPIMRYFPESAASAVGIPYKTVGNQQKWDTFVKERSRGCSSVTGLPALPVVALTPL